MFFISIIVSILIGIAFITVWYIKQIIEKDNISVYQSWVTSWSLNFILFTYYLISSTLGVNNPKTNILMQSITIVILITFLQIAVLIKINSYDIEKWTPTVLKLVGPVKGILTSLLLCIPILLPRVPTFSDSFSVRNFTSCGYIDYDIYYETVCSILLAGSYFCLKYKKPELFIKISLALYVIGWIMELTSSILPTHPDWLFLVSWILTAIAVPLSIIGVILNQKTPFKNGE